MSCACDSGRRFAGSLSMACGGAGKDRLRLFDSHVADDVAMPAPSRRSRAASIVWAGAVTVAIAAAGGLVALGWWFRGECDEPSCDDWVIADAIATGVAL